MLFNWNLMGEFYSITIITILFTHYISAVCNGRLLAPSGTDTPRHSFFGVVRTALSPIWGFITMKSFRQERSSKQQEPLFLLCLLFSGLYIWLNIFRIYLKSAPDALPRWGIIAINSFYYHLGVCLTCLFAYLLFGAMLEHTYNKRRMRQVTRMLQTIVLLSLALLLINLFTGMYFRIAEDGTYHRGPLFITYYFLVIFQVLALVFCYFRNRSSVGNNMVSVIRSIPALAFAMCVLQYIYPGSPMNGTVAATACLVIFIAFRHHPDGVDSLTGVGSNSAFIDELRLRSENAQAVQIIQFSLLNLADANFRWGHSVGDALLYEVAHYFQKSSLPAQIFRTNNTTFALILPLESPEVAEARLEQVKNKLLQRWTLGDVHFQLEVAIAELRSENLTGKPGRIVDHLSYTLAKAKENPPLARFDSTVHDLFDQRNRTLELMQRSIAEKLFYVVYQPLYCCHRRQFCSAEALLRLRDADGIPISPEVFIPLAEEHGMIGELTELVLEDVCRVLKSGRFPGLESISVNMSMQQLLDPGLSTYMKEILDRHGVSPSLLKLEITERFLLHDMEYAKEQLQKLKDEGFLISMDDFGTGYSNLSNILHLPFTYIKLDRSLITPITESPEAATMVHSLCQLFHSLHKFVVAEGVETEAQAKALHDMGMDMIQGYYFARPTQEAELGPYFSEAPAACIQCH